MKSKYVKRVDNDGNNYFGVTFTLSYSEIADAINTAYEDLGEIERLHLHGDGRLTADACRDYCWKLGNVLSCIEFSIPDGESALRTASSIRQLNQMHARLILGIVRPGEFDPAG